MSRKHSPLIVPVFLPHAGCPHRCVFCDQRAVTGVRPALRGANAVKEAVETYAQPRKGNERPVQIAFYGGNFLGLPDETMGPLLAAADRFVQAGRADSIRFSTRPDTIDDKTLALIHRYPVSTVEIGAQSMSDRVLAKSRRGHSAADTIRAVQLLKAKGIETGVQMMVGLPGDDDRTARSSGAAIAALAPAFVRIYPTVVLADSRLGRWYAKGRYKPLELEEAVSITKRLWALFHHAGIAVIRMGLQASADLEKDSAVVAGPYHPAFGHLVHEGLFFDAVRRGVGATPISGPIEIQVHPRNLSKINGLNHQNLHRLRDYFDPNPVQVRSNPQVDPASLIVNQTRCRLDNPAAVKGASA